MRSVIYVNAFRCQMWALHDRLEDYVTAASCKAEIESFQKHGQLVPALGRALKGNPDYDIELIYGARRLFVARPWIDQILEWLLEAASIGIEAQIGRAHV